MKTVRNEIVSKVYEVKLELEKEENQTTSGSENSKGTAAVVAGDDCGDEADLAFLFLEKELEHRNLVTLDQLPLKDRKDIVDFANSLPSSVKLFSVIQKMQITEKLSFPTSEASTSTIKVAKYK